MKTKSRLYQEDHINRIIESVTRLRKIVGQMPTGGGKTVEFSLIAQRYSRVTDKAVLICVHREELMKQAAKTIESITGVRPALITSETNRYKHSSVYIAMVESLKSRLNLFDNVGLVIIDECHIANFNKLHEMFPTELIIGFSATPISSSKKIPLKKYYHDIVVGQQIRELIEMGFLSQNVTRAPVGGVDSSKFSVKSLTGDFDEKQMDSEFRNTKFITNVVQQYFKYCNGEKTVVFNVSIEHSKEVAKCFQIAGFNARHLDANSSNIPSSDPRFRNEREEILHWFKVTKDAILCNVMIATVGWDEPTLINVILNFSTMSLTKFIQCCGRGGRVIDEAFIDRFHNDYPYELSLKSHFNIIDLGGNYQRFGDWSDDRDWKSIFFNPERSGDGIAPVKTCPSCEGLLHAAKRVCDLRLPDGNICLHEFDKSISTNEIEILEMNIVTKGVDILKMKEKNKNKYEYYTFLDMAVPVIKSMYNSYKLSDINEKLKMRYFDIYYSLCINWWKIDMAEKYPDTPDITRSAYHIRRAKNNFEQLLIKLMPKDIVAKSFDKQLNF